MADQVEILLVSRVDATDPARRGKADFLVTYAVNKLVGRLLRVPAEGATKDSLERAVRKEVADLGSLQGHTFST